MRKGLKGPLGGNPGSALPPQKACLLAANQDSCSGVKGGDAIREDNPSTHKHKNRVKEESSYTQLLSSYWISWLFSAMLYHTQ